MSPNAGRAPLLLLAGEGGPLKAGRMRGVAAPTLDKSLNGLLVPDSLPGTNPKRV